VSPIWYVDSLSKLNSLVSKFIPSAFSCTPPITFSKRFDKNSVFFFGQIITGAIFIAFRFIGVNSYLIAIIMGIVFIHFHSLIRIYLMEGLWQNNQSVVI
jgi:hypothetical protein